MTEITLYNTRTRSKEPFVPIDPKNVRMYVCGPTVYDRAHIGNARPVVVFDVLYRLLRHVYGEGAVTYVRNVTDVDDKINARAAAEKRPIRELTDETLAAYHADMDALGALRPTHEPRATEYIGPMVAMIEALIARGNAYVAEGHVLFAVGSFPAYGRFANRSLDEMQAGARVEVAPYKRDPMDFVLWKPSSSAEPGWPSPWGHGRPGWHIECSAMSEALLGASFDIHGGGIDLVFPHHENEIAQSMCAHPEGEFARVWLHNGFLNVEGEKMSKSLGNFFTVRDLLDKGIPGEVIRFVLLSTHYRQPMDWREDKVRLAMKMLASWFRMTAGVQPNNYGLFSVVPDLANDLNTPEAIKNLNELADQGEAEQLKAALDLLGLSPSNEWYQENEWEKGRDGLMVSLFWSGHVDPELQDAVWNVAFRWANLRKLKDYERADALRSLADEAGVDLRASADSDADAEIRLSNDYSKLRLLQ